MADTDDRDSKTLEPTETKIRKAIEEGRTPAARDAALFASVTGLLILLLLLPGPSGGGMLASLAALLEAADWRIASPADATALLARILRSEAAGLTLLALGVLLGLGLAAGTIPALQAMRLRIVEALRRD